MKMSRNASERERVKSERERMNEPMMSPVGAPNEGRRTAAPEGSGGRRRRKKAPEDGEALGFFPGAFFLVQSGSQAVRRGVAS